VQRRNLFLAVIGSALIPLNFWKQLNGKTDPEHNPTLLTAPLELRGEWLGAAPTDVLAVASRTREACLAGIRLLSDRQPQKLWVESRAAGPPHIWLHDEPPDTAWIVVHVAERAWAQHAYQFGHELGHVLCNSWLRGSTLKPPSRWLERLPIRLRNRRC